MAWLRRPLNLLGPLVVAGFVLSSCGSGGAAADARLSCRSVHAAVILEQQSQRIGIAASTRSKLEASAISRLLEAEPSAADATSIDGSWNPLMTTINEAGRVPLPILVPALTRLCKIANSSSPYL